MQKQQLIVFVLVTVLSLGSKVKAWRCYQCVQSGSSDPDNCKNPTPTTTPTCTTTLQCMKADGKGGGGSAVQRGCAPQVLPTGCTDYQVADVKGKVCECKSELCNTGSTGSIGSMFAVGFMAALASLLITRGY